MGSVTGQSERKVKRMQTRKFDELISYFNRNVSNMDIDQKYKIELFGMITAIGFAHEKELHNPTIEPQPEIIRCRDCKYWREHKYAKETKRYIPFCGFNAIYTKADDFCSRAERRTDDT